MSRQMSATLALAIIVGAVSGCASMQQPTHTHGTETAAPAVATTMATANTPTTLDAVPPNAKAGECYTRVTVAPTFKTEEQQLLKRAASERVELIPAKYDRG